MAYIQKDRVKETTTTTGTGAVTLAGAVAGFQAFSAVMTVNDTCYYVIVSATGTDWETGTGTYSSASVLTRTTVLSSSNSGNAVSFAAGTKDVFMGPIASSVNDIAHGGTGATTAADARTNLGVSTGTVTSVSGTGTVSGLSLSGTVTSSGSLTLGGTLSAIPLATGVSGTLPVANGGTGVTTSTGTTNVVLSNSPTLVTPFSNTLSAIPIVSGLTASVTAASGTVAGPNATITYTAAGHSFTVGRTVTVTSMTIVTGNSLNCSGRTIISVTSTTFVVADFIGSGSASTATSAVANNATAGGNSFTNTSSNAVTAGPGGNYHFKAGDGAGIGKGGDIEFEMGLQGSSGGDGAVSFVHQNGSQIMKYTSAKQFQSQMAGVSYGWEGTNHGLRSSLIGSGYLSLTVNGGYNLLSVNASNLHTTCAAGPFADTTVRFLLTNNWSTASGGSEVLTGHFALSCGLSDGVAIVRNGATAIAGGSFAFPSNTTGGSPTTIALNTDNLVLTGSAFQRINCTAPSNLTGIAPPTGGTHDDGRMIRVYNVGAAALTLKHNVTSTATNLFFSTTGLDIVLITNAYAELIYDITDNGRGGAGWRVR